LILIASRRLRPRSWSPEGIRDVLADRYTFERELGRGGMGVVVKRTIHDS